MGLGEWIGVTKGVSMDLQNTNQADMIAVIKELRAELDAQKQAAALAKAQTGTIKVSTKGAVSVYGFGRWPVTLYKSQWIKLFERVEEIKAFIKSNNQFLVEKE